MTFLWPEALAALIVLPALAGTYLLLLRRRARIIVHYPSLSIVREAMDPGQALRRHLPPLLALIGFAVLLLATARPAAVWTVPAERGTVVLAIDVSLSMAATDVAPSRLAAAQAAATAFIDAQPAGVLVGIVAFAGHAELVQSPTTNRDDLMAALGRLQFRRYTSIGNGVVAALQALEPGTDLAGEHDVFGDDQQPPEPQKVSLRQYDNKTRPRRRPGSELSTAIILVSDGYGALGVPPLDAARMAADRGVRVYTVGVGTLYGGTAYVEGMPPLHADFEEDTLKQIADATGGDYFYAGAAHTMKKIYKKLSTRAALERKESEITTLFSALGAALLLAAAALSLAWCNPLLR